MNNDSVFDKAIKAFERTKKKYKNALKWLANDETPTKEDKP